MIVECREFDLEAALPGLGALAENLQDEPGAVDHLAAPGALQITLLDRGQGPIDDDDLDRPRRESAPQFLHFAAPKQRRRADRAQGRGLGELDVEADGFRERHRFGQGRPWVAAKITPTRA